VVAFGRSLAKTAGQVAALGGLIQIGAMFLPNPSMSSLPAVTPSDVQVEVENALLRYTVAQPSQEFNAIKAFAEIDVENTLQFYLELQWVNATQGSRAQAIIDDEIQNWYEEMIRSWHDY